MKEITRIHLAKTPYDIELDAKEVLQKYLSEIKQMMGSEDAMYEIEARMVELLGERGVQSNGIITMSDVEDLRSKMGLPKEFSDSESTEDSQANLTPSNSPAKRLMRDTDNAIFGGVCAGIAAYWGINPLWVRLLFIISPFITFGTALLVYIIIWISLPEAKTAAEKLQMRGEPVTLDSLKKAANNSESKYR
ncbi:MAG: PspC domain-containing protein, partial [Candidatus Saccharibacteria bacterium]|nr:PspC domain-containing protein [Candidatus Saccharibacteria bacterium]